MLSEVPGTPHSWFDELLATTVSSRTTMSDPPEPHSSTFVAHVILRKVAVLRCKDVVYHTVDV